MKCLKIDLKLTFLYRTNRVVKKFLRLKIDGDASNRKKIRADFLSPVQNCFSSAEFGSGATKIGLFCCRERTEELEGSGCPADQVCRWDEKTRLRPKPLIGNRLNSFIFRSICRLRRHRRQRRRHHRRRHRLGGLCRQQATT